MPRLGPALKAHLLGALLALLVVQSGGIPVPTPERLLQLYESQTETGALAPLRSSPSSQENTLNSSPSPPSARWGHEVTYHADRGEMILFGGGNFECPDLRCNDTWAYDPSLDMWTNLTTELHPGGRWAHAMAHDPDRKRTVMFGGIDPGPGPPPPVPKTWAYLALTNTWTDLAPSSEPPTLTRHDMVYDAFSDRFVVFGGVFERGVMDETWVYDPGNNTWTSMNPESQPSPRTFPAMVYHPAARVTILYGGLIGGEGNDETWRYSLVDNSWTRLDPPFAPFPRAGHALSYDPVSGLVILFGGLVTSDPPGRHDDDETWTYDVFSNLWARREPASRPPARSQHAMTYDTQMGRVLLFGGRGIDRFNDTWAYDVANNTWTELPLRTDPDPERLPILLAVVFSVMILGILTVVFLVERFGGTSDRRRADSDKRKSRGGNQFRLRRLR